MERRFGWPTAVTLHPERLEEPLKHRKPSKIFVCSMSDLFHEDVPLGFIAQMFDVMASATLACTKRHEHDEECWSGPPHTFQILTKRPARMLQVLKYDLPNYVGECYPGDSALSVAMSVDWPLPNVWLGVTAENQARADERIPLLLQTPAAVRFVSVEPMLEKVDLSTWVGPEEIVVDENPYGYSRNYCGIHWVILGGENGPGARLMNPYWARAVADQCRAAGVPLFWKGPGSVFERQVKGGALDLCRRINRQEFPEVRS